jgi:hypothetical protein
MRSSDVCSLLTHTGEEETPTNKTLIFIFYINKVILFLLESRPNFLFISKFYEELYREWAVLLDMILSPFIYFAVARTVVNEIHILTSRYLYVSKPMLVFIISWTHFP